MEERGSSRKETAPPAQTLGEEPRPVWGSRQGRTWGLRAGLPSPSRGWWGCCRWRRWHCTQGTPQSTSGSCLREQARGWWSAEGKKKTLLRGWFRSGGMHSCYFKFVLNFSFLEMQHAYKLFLKVCHLMAYYKVNTYVATTQNLHTDTPDTPKSPWLLW